MFATNHLTMYYSDKENPAYLFTMTDGSLLIKIAKGELDAVEAAKRELANRGFNEDGEWVGFKKS